ncbi:MAG TPA: hypothetical protein VF131_01425 [Blastocatellia bacterium]|nr:hypothetical protein [Blastocatellia bacterium]
MKSHRKSIKAPLSLLLVMALMISFSFSSMANSAPAATDVDAIAESITFTQAPTATLTAKGPVDVNGNRAKTGATVLNGSIIQAFTGGHATIELGALGRVDIEPHTTITLNMVGNGVEISLNQCGSVTLTVPSGVSSLVKVLHVRDVGLWSERREIDVDVTRGEATVKYEVPTQEKIVLAGQHKEFTHATEVTATGDALYRVRCHEDHYPVALFLPLGALLIPVFNDEEPPVLSTLQP